MRPRRGARPWTIGVAVACASAAPLPACGAEGSVHGLLGATTDYVFRGVSQTRGSSAMQGGLSYQRASGWFVGAWGSTINPNPGAGATTEWNAYAGHDWRVGTAWNLRVSAVHYAYPGDSSYLSYDYDELAVTVTYLDRLSAGVAISPNTSRYSRYDLARDRTALSYDLVARWPLRGPLIATASVGYYDLDDLFGTGYGYWSAGLACAWRHLLVELAHYSTSNSAVDLFGAEVAGNRWALSATWRFGD